MKKTLIALAAVAVSSAAMAQVNMSGYINYQYNKDGKATSTSGLFDAGITFSATEDLGNGMKASAAFNIDSIVGRSEKTANGDSTLSLSGGFGAVTAARTRSSSMAASGVVFGATVGTGFNDGIVFERRDINALSYTSPELAPGLRVSVSTSNVLEKVTFKATDFNVTTIGATYATGPLSLGIQQKSQNNAFKAAAAAGTEAKNTEAFVRYNAGVALIGVGYGSALTTTGKAVTSYGVSVPMGAITFGIDAAKRGDAKFMNYGVRYALSKRTSLQLGAGKYQTTATNSKDQKRMRVVHSF